MIKMLIDIMTGAFERKHVCAQRARMDAAVNALRDSSSKRKKIAAETVESVCKTRRATEEAGRVIKKIGSGEHTKVEETDVTHS